MKKFWYIFSTVLALFSGARCCAADAVLAREGDSNCYDIEVVFARGSGGEFENTQEYFELKKTADRIFADFNRTARFSDLDYPATDVSAPLRLIRAFVSAGRGYEFGRGVRQGVNGLRMHYRNIHRQCPDTKWVLIGYSQGAMVMADVVKYFQPESVAHVMLFGDPETYLPEGAGLFPDACMRRNYSTWRRYVPECRTYKGVFGGRDPYEPVELKYRYSLWCNADDYICGSSRNPFRNSGHTKYAEYMAQDFRRLLVRIIDELEDPLSERWATLSAARLATATISSGATIDEYDDRILVRWNAETFATKYLLLRLNGVDLGYIDVLDGEIEIRDVDWNEENNIILLPMAEDGELAEEAVALEIVDKRTVSPPEIIISPVDEPASDSAKQPTERPAGPETPLKLESAPEPEEPKATDGLTDEKENDAPRREVINNDDVASPLPEPKQKTPFSSSPLKLTTKRGFDYARASDIAKIVLATLAAASALIVFLIRRK